MDLTSFILLISILLNVALGLFVYLSNSLLKTNQYFLGLALSVSLWIYTNLVVTSIKDTSYGLLIAILGYLSAILIGYTFLRFSDLFLSDISGFTQNQKRILNAITILVIALMFVPNLAIQNIELNPWKINTGNGVLVIFAFFILIMAWSFRILRNKQKKSEDIQKRQIGFIFAGTILATLCGSFFNLFLPLAVNNYNFVRLGPVFTVFMVGSIAFAIVKYRLFNLKVIAAQLLTASLWLFITVRLLISQTTEDQIANGSLLVLTVFFGFLLVRSVIREVEIREKVERLAKDLESANEKLTELDQQKSEFVSIASHQLRSPLTAIKGYSSMLLEGSFGKTTKKVGGAIHTIFESSESLVRVIDNFLNLSRIEQGRMTYDMAPTDLKLLTQSVVEQLLPNIEKKGLKVRFEVASEHAEYVANLDKNKVQQVILNVLDNSAKYTPSGSILVKIDRNVGGKISIVISDTGIGMSKETIAKLFQKFSRAEGAGKVNAGGTGLGMYLARQIMEANGGVIRAESDGVGKGSRFIIEF
ncbi:MAG: ATP-binding protein [Patescibacteria group bacterium]